MLYGYYPENTVHRTCEPVCEHANAKRIRTAG